VAEGVSASSLQAGFVELASIVRALHGDWSAPASGYEGWTCKDLLAHLSSTEASLPAQSGRYVYVITGSFHEGDVSFFLPVDVTR